MSALYIDTYPVRTHKVLNLVLSIDLIITCIITKSMVLALSRSQGE